MKIKVCTIQSAIVVETNNLYHYDSRCMVFHLLTSCVDSRASNTAVPIWRILTLYGLPSIGLMCRLESIEHRRPYQEVCKGAHHQRESAHVLPTHTRSKTVITEDVSLLLWALFLIINKFRGTRILKCQGAQAATSIIWIHLTTNLWKQATSLFIYIHVQSLSTITLLNRY